MLLIFIVNHLTKEEEVQNMLKNKYYADYITWEKKHLTCTEIIKDDYVTVDDDVILVHF
jgi:hypothetical protein